MRAVLPITTGELRGRRRSLVGWAVALTSVCSMYVGLYPSMERIDMDSMIDALPDGMVQALGYDQIGTAAGYLDSTIYSLLAFVLLTIVAVTTGARSIAGGEEDESLELELASPQPRTRIHLERWLAMAAFLGALVGVVAVVCSALVVGMGLDVALGRLWGVSLGLFEIVLLFGSAAFAAGAATGRRGIALGVGAGLAVVSWMGNALGPMVGADWMTTISPVSWYSAAKPLLNGVDWGGLARLAVSTVVVVAAGRWRFDRRDLMV